jgi:hypothetical protein
LEKFSPAAQWDRRRDVSFFECPIYLFIHTLNNISFVFPSHKNNKLIACGNAKKTNAEPNVWRYTKKKVRAYKQQKMVREM